MFKIARYHIPSKSTTFFDIDKDRLDKEWQNHMHRFLCNYYNDSYMFVGWLCYFWTNEFYSYSIYSE